MKLGEKRFDQTQQRIRNKHGSHAKDPQEQWNAGTLPCYNGVMSQTLNPIVIVWE